jgi:very-short-patch-repair endonuclease
MSLLAMPAHTNRTLRQHAKRVCRDLRKAQTDAEHLLWEQLRNRRFQGLKFCRQHPILVDCLGVETFFVADFFCFERRLVIEVDGRVHDYTVDHDQLRTFVMRQFGIHVVRFRNEQIETALVQVLEGLRDVVSTDRDQTHP